MEVQEEGTSFPYLELTLSKDGEQTGGRGLWRVSERAKLERNGKNELETNVTVPDPCSAYHDCATCQGASCKWCMPREDALHGVQGNATAHYHCATKCGSGFMSGGCSPVDFVMTLIFLALLVCVLPLVCCCVFYMCPRPHFGTSDYTFIYEVSKCIESTEAQCQPREQV